MKSPDPRDFGLNRFQSHRLQKCLQPGERLYWAGAPAYLGVNLPLLYWCVCFCMGMAAFVCWRASLEESPGLFILASFPAMLGVGLMVLPYVIRREARRTVYAITNRRVLVCAKTDESWPLAFDMVISNLQNEKGIGNLVFALRPSTDPDCKHLFDEVGFMYVRDVRLVEEILEKAITERVKA